MAIEQFINNEVKGNDVVLFMKGTPQFPMCGFSGQVVQILDHLGVSYKGVNVHQILFQLADHPAALREGRIRRRLRHRARNVSGGRIAGPAEGQGRFREGTRRDLSPMASIVYSSCPASCRASMSYFS